jgi:hypothetical protein
MAATSRWMKKLAFHATDAPNEVAKLQDTHALKNEFTEDAASIIVTRYDGQRYRLPKGDAALSHAPASRSIRECIQERYLANYHGTFYEVPRGGTSPLRPAQHARLPAHEARRHSQQTHRRLLRLARHARPQRSSNIADDRLTTVTSSATCEAKLWFGAIDDLWKLGQPTRQRRTVERHRRERPTNPATPISSPATTRRPSPCPKTPNNPWSSSSRWTSTPTANGTTTSASPSSPASPSCMSFQKAMVLTGCV